MFTFNKARARNFSPRKSTSYWQVSCMKWLPIGEPEGLHLTGTWRDEEGSRNGAPLSLKRFTVEGLEEGLLYWGP
jgi:hypothetical protein